MSEFKLRPPRPSAKAQQQGDNRAWSKAFQGMMRIVRMTSSSSGSRKGGARRAPSPRMQRCAIRVTYSPNRVRGQWAAHGRYIEREGGLTEGIAAKLAAWQKAGDERMFKIIVSPEFGERIDLDGLARDLMTRVSGELGVPLEWAAAAHRNTDHPHLHIALRGNAGLRLPRDYVKHGLRRAAEALCTAQLGYRTELDIRESERREVTAQQVTSLDRRLARLQPGAKLTPLLAVREGTPKQMETLGTKGRTQSEVRNDSTFRASVVAPIHTSNTSGQPASRLERQRPAMQEPSAVRAPKRLVGR